MSGICAQAAGCAHLHRPCFFCGGVRGKDHGFRLTGLFCRLADRQRIDFHYLRRPISSNQEERPVSSTNLRDDQMAGAAAIRLPELRHGYVACPHRSSLCGRADSNPTVFILSAALAAKPRLSRRFRRPQLAPAAETGRVGKCAARGLTKRFAFECSGVEANKPLRA